MIKYNIKTVNDWLYNSNPIKGMYYNGRRVYRRFVANGQPTPPTPPVFDGKWKATYSNGNVTSAECDSTSAISRNEINLSNLVSVEIGDCVTSIGTSVFYNCTSLTSVTIGNSVTFIGYQVFSGCDRLTSIGIPYSVTTINNRAFQGCNSLTGINIPSGVTSIGEYAFWNCTSLTSITVEAVDPPTLGADVFKNTNNCPIYVPDESVDAYKTANRWSSYASRIKPISEKPQ